MTDDIPIIRSSRAQEEQEKKSKKKQSSDEINKDKKDGDSSHTSKNYILPILTAVGIGLGLASIGLNIYYVSFYRPKTQFKLNEYKDLLHQYEAINSKLSTGNKSLEEGQNSAVKEVITLQDQLKSINNNSLSLESEIEYLDKILESKEAFIDTLTTKLDRCVKTYYSQFLRK